MYSGRVARLTIKSCGIALCFSVAEAFTAVDNLTDTYPLEMLYESSAVRSVWQPYARQLTSALEQTSTQQAGGDFNTLLRLMNGTTGGAVYGFSQEFAEYLPAQLIRSASMQTEPDYYDLARQAIRQSTDSDYDQQADNGIDLIDDSYEANHLVHMRIVFPSISPSTDHAEQQEVTEAVFDNAYRETPLTTNAANAIALRNKSHSQPYIDLSPKWNPKPGSYVSRYIKALIRLQKQLPQGSTLRLFPTATADGQHLTCEVVLIYPDASGNLRYSAVMDIIRDWGAPGSAVWLTDRIAQGNLGIAPVENLWQRAMNNSRANPATLPVFNPVDAEMIEVLAELVKEYLQDPDADFPYSNNFDFRDIPRPIPVEIKRSGYLAALDAGGMVFFIDTFASQSPDTTRITLKKVAFEKVDADTLAELDEQRIKRYPGVLKGEPPFNPKHQLVEMAFLKLLIRQAAHYGLPDEFTD